MSEPTRFTVTDQHLKLMSNFRVAWCDDEYGAPAIDPKRPYGNSSVPDDISRILGWDTDELDYDDPPSRRIHQQTMFALQIALRVGYFKAGNYERPNAYSTDWKEV